MPKGYFQIKGELKTREQAAEVVKALGQSGGLRLTVPQVLSAGLAIGVRAIKDDPSVLLSIDRARKKSS